MNDFFEQVLQAKNEAEKREIKANAILISDKLYFSKYSATGMICGLKPLYTNELPDDTLFAVIHADVLPQTVRTNYDRIKNMSVEEMAEKVLNCCNNNDSCNTCVFNQKDNSHFGSHCLLYDITNKEAIEWLESEITK